MYNISSSVWEILLFHTLNKSTIDSFNYTILTGVQWKLKAGLIVFFLVAKHIESFLKYLLASYIFFGVLSI